MRANGAYEALLNEIRGMRVIDTHEHLPWDERALADEPGDVLREYLAQYLRSDIISAGLSPADFARVVDGSLPIRARWAIVEPYWEAARYTGYGRAIDIAVRGIYGIDGVRGETIEALNDAYLAARKPGHQAHVLRERCNIEMCLTDSWDVPQSGAHDIFRFIWQPSDFIRLPEGGGAQMLAFIEGTLGIPVNGLDDWQAALEARLDGMLAHCGVRVIKCALAYERTLRFEETPYAEARALFDDALGKWRAGEPAPFPRALQDYMMHRVLTLAGKRNLTVQFHTGLLEGNGNVLSNSDPMLLENLFLRYPDVDFDLFHIGYPFQSRVSALAKMFPNVYIDMCWAHIISPSASVQALHDFLDAVPHNKISGFGGDYVFVDGVYGHLELSRQNIAKTLSEKVCMGVFGEEKALDIARALYYDNPKRIFKL
ncbi:MAG: amidohydrolase family protein [Christensenellales bacterium]|jgi:hypothetical protein